MVPPAKPEVVCKELDSALRLAHASNPAVKSPAKVISLLRYIPLMNQTELFGLVKGCFESPSLSRNSSRLLLEALLHYIARVRADKAFPTYWEQLRGHFDEQLATSWHQSQSAQMTRTQFLRASRDALQLFISMDCATEVEKSLAAGDEPQVNLVETLCKEGVIGAELFQAESLKLEMKSYMSEISERLHELDICGFDLVEVESSKRICTHVAPLIRQSCLEAV